MVLLEATVERQAECVPLAAHPTERQAVKYVGVSLSLCQGAEHGQTRDSEDIRGHATELQIAPFQQVLGAVALCGGSLDQLSLGAQ